jgi:hypothetical protein
MENVVWPFLALIALLGMSTLVLAGEIKAGATMQVKANSIWFDTQAQLARWQALKKGGNAKNIAKYQEKLMSEREAWQFVNPLTVEVLRYDVKKPRVEVKMTNEGRMQGAIFWIDADALMP